MNSTLLDHSLTQATELSLLENLLDKVLEKHFEKHPSFSIRWGIPGATAVRRTFTPPAVVLDEQGRAHLSRCKSLMILGRWEQAAKLIKPLADAGHPEAECLIAHALRRTGGNWEAYAQRYAKRAHQIHTVPASSHDRKQREIILHSYLAHRKAPQFVLIYLIYHECSKCVYPATAEAVTSTKFMIAEKNAPYREKAIRWLSRHGFPFYQFEP